MEVFLMKNKIMQSVVIAAVCLISLTACQTEKTAEPAAEQVSETDGAKPEAEPADAAENADNTENTKNADNTQVSPDTEKNDAADTKKGELTFSDLSEWSYEFCSGAGGWSTDFEIEADGSFAGNYHDSDMGDTGDGYPDGTVYYCDFSGHFTDLTKLDDTVYEMKLADIEYHNTPGDTEIKEGIRYVYSEVYGLEGTDRFKIYLPGTPVDTLSEEVYGWVSVANDSETELTMTVIENEANQYGIYSYSKQTPYEQAKELFDSSRSTCEQLNDKLLTETGLTEQEECDYAAQMYTVSDTCINEIWKLIKENTDESRYNEILTGQRTWIAEKEAAGEEIRKTYTGSKADLEADKKLAEMTIRRCAALVENLK